MLTIHLYFEMTHASEALTESEMHCSSNICRYRHFCRPSHVCALGPGSAGSAVSADSRGRKRQQCPNNVPTSTDASAFVSDQHAPKRLASEALTESESTLAATIVDVFDPESPLSLVRGQVCKCVFSALVGSVGARIMKTLDIFYLYLLGVFQ